MLLVIRGCDGFRRTALEQPRARGLLAPLQFADLLVRIAGFRGRPWHRSALRLELARAGVPASRAAPPSTGSRRVVAPHRRARFVGNGRRRVALERQLDRLQMNGGIMERQRSREPVELLELLDRVALDAGTQRLTHDGVEIHEALAAQEPVELLGARGVAAHQPLEGRRLVVAEVVDVRAGIRGPASA